MWVRKGERILPRENRRWARGRVLVWGIIGIGWKRLVILPALAKENEPKKPFRLTGETYRRHCLDPIMDFMARRQVTMQQDGAGPHKGAQEYLNARGVRMLAGWPARSPQLSPIETLWGLMQPVVAARMPTSRAELQTEIIAAWEGLDQAMIDRLIMGFEGRLIACRAARGAA